MTIDGGARSRILLISYHFPPSAAVGGMRMANFAKWLPSLGWEPHVLTIQDSDIEQVDRERLRDVEGIPIHKVAVLRTFADRYAALKARFRGPAKAASPSDAERIEQTGPDPQRGENLSRRLRRYARSFVALPDYERGWIIPAVWAAIRRMRQQRISWIMTSCPPYSGHLVGLALKIISGVKWAADFRDPWMAIGMKRSYPTSAMSLWIESWLEKKVVQKADLLVFNVERMRDAYRERYARVPGHKFVFIPNGVDFRALAGMAPVTKYENFTLSYTGSLYVRRSPEPVFLAVSQLIREGKATPESVRIKLIGHCRTVEGVPTASLIRKYGLDSNVEVRDSLPYSEAMEVIRRSHLALLFAPDLPYQIPAKAYDYLGAGVRILAIAESGATADLVSNSGSGRAFPPADVAGIKEFILHEMGSRGATNQTGAANIVRFDVRRITEDLAANLNRIATVGVADAVQS